MAGLTHLLVCSSMGHSKGDADLSAVTISCSRDKSPPLPLPATSQTVFTACDATCQKKHDFVLLGNREGTCTRNSLRPLAPYAAGLSDRSRREVTTKHTAHVVRSPDDTRWFHAGLVPKLGRWTSNDRNKSGQPFPSQRRPVPVACHGDISCDPVENLVGHEDTIFPFSLPPSRHRKTSQGSSGNLMSPQWRCCEHDCCRNWANLRFNRVHQPAGLGLLLNSEYGAVSWIQ